MTIGIYVEKVSFALGAENPALTLAQRAPGSNLVSPQSDRCQLDGGFRELTKALSRKEFATTIVLQEL
jgi:hypothetical protein